MNTQRPGSRWWPRSPRQAVVLALLGVCVLLWPLSGWDMWPWVAGLVTVIVAGATVSALGLRHRIGAAWIVAAGLAVVLGMLVAATPVAAWGLAAGTALTIAGLALYRHGVGPRWGWLAAGAVGLTLVAVTATVLAVTEAQRAHHQQQLEKGDREFQLAQMLPSSPNAVVTSLVTAIARDDAEHGCFLFSERATEQFAAAHDASDCPAALASLHADIRSWGDYVNNVSVPGRATEYHQNGRVTIDGCDLDWSRPLTESGPAPGPDPGVLTLAQQHGQGWLIIDYQTCSG